MKMKPKLMAYSTKPPAHPEDGDRVRSRNVGKPSHIDAADYSRKFHQINHAGAQQQARLDFCIV
jgi:hypothetical protein